MNCTNFCKGAKNTRLGVIAEDLAIEIAYAHKLKPNGEGNFPCPCGVKVHPLTEEAMLNFKNNNGSVGSICLNHPHRKLLLGD